MQVTNRDREMLQWINGHGYVTVRQAAIWMGVAYPTAAVRIRKLTDNGLLQHERPYFAAERSHWLTANGKNVAKDPLTPPRGINRITHFHDQMLVDLALKISDEKKGTFFPERRLRSNFLSGGKRTTSHLPDGLLHVEGRMPIAIELEMSLKNQGRLSAIISSYVTNLKFEEIWYFVTNREVRDAVTRTINGNKRFKVLNWECA